MCGHTNSDLAQQRFEQILRLIQGDDVSLSLLENLLESAERYFQTVVSMEHKVRLARLRLEGQNLRDFIHSLDTHRSLSHNTLLDNIAILNRYLFKKFGPDAVPVGGIYSKDPESIRVRALVGDWAGELLYGLYLNRKR